MKKKLLTSLVALATIGACGAANASTTAGPVEANFKVEATVGDVQPSVDLAIWSKQSGSQVQGTTVDATFDDNVVAGNGSEHWGFNLSATYSPAPRFDSLAKQYAVEVTPHHAHISEIHLETTEKLLKDAAGDEVAGSTARMWLPGTNGIIPGPINDPTVAYSWGGTMERGAPLTQSYDVDANGIQYQNGESLYLPVSIVAWMPVGDYSSALATSQSNGSPVDVSPDQPITLTVTVDY
ncbi:hypothetical protein M9194_07760 [Vibrio sp. S4M6]|uniref:hypothetical protein n=1 Tax=Vibrio sinus TaxID=2946865 RepID=UPI002029E4B6|nr:hypothetical protein [Vibrio sinus]MCL9781321.1 hypothetical protein [Vibrio sinus]